MRTLAARLAALAERYVRELEATPGVDLATLAEALALYKMARFALRRRRPQKRKWRQLSAHPRESGDPGVASTEQEALDSRVRGNKRAESVPLSPHTPPALRLFAELRAASVDLERVPEEAVKDYIESRLYEDLRQRPRNRTKRERYEAWMREKEKDH
jgi:hypothetical protein